MELGDHEVGRVVPGSRSSGRGLAGGRGAGLGVDGPAGGDTEEVLRLGDPESGGVGRGTFTLPGEGSHADPLLGRRSLRLGGEEGRGESGVGLLPSESGGGERRIRGSHLIFFIFNLFYNNILSLTRIGFYLQGVARLVAPARMARQIASVAPHALAR